MIASGRAEYHLSSKQRHTAQHSTAQGVGRKIPLFAIATQAAAVRLVRSLPGGFDSAEIPARLDFGGTWPGTLEGADRRATPSGEPCIKARSRDLFVWARTRAHGCCLCCPGSVPIISACGVRRGEQAPYWYWYGYWYCSAPARSGCRSGVSITHLWLYMP